MKIISRPYYMERLLNLKDTPDIKIITGVRRCGKSRLLAAFIEKVKLDKDANIIFIDFMDLKYETLKEYHAFYDYVESKYESGKKNYLFVDEVQMCSGFELAINSLHAKEKYDIYITGSNAFLLSADRSERVH